MPPSVLTLNCQRTDKQVMKQINQLSSHKATAEPAASCYAVLTNLSTCIPRNTSSVRLDLIKNQCYECECECSDLH